MWWCFLLLKILKTKHELNKFIFLHSFQRSEGFSKGEDTDSGAVVVPIGVEFKEFKGVE